MAEPSPELAEILKGMTTEGLNPSSSVASAATDTATNQELFDLGLDFYNPKKLPSLNEYYDELKNLLMRGVYSGALSVEQYNKYITGLPRYFEVTARALGITDKDASLTEDILNRLPLTQIVMGSSESKNLWIYEGKSTIAAEEAQHKEWQKYFDQLATNKTFRAAERSAVAEQQQQALFGFQPPQPLAPNERISAMGERYTQPDLEPLAPSSIEPWASHLSPAQKQYFSFNRLASSFLDEGGAELRDKWWESISAPPAQYNARQNAQEGMRRTSGEMEKWQRQTRNLIDPTSPLEQLNLDAARAMYEGNYNAYNQYASELNTPYERSSGYGGIIEPKPQDPWLSYLEKYPVREEWLGMSPRQRGFSMSRFAPKARFIE